MLLAVEACHSAQIAHRDVKLENFLLSGDLTTIVLTDFQHSGKIQVGKLFVERRGSLAYCSPEMALNQPYSGTAVDVWSLGIWHVTPNN